MNVLAMMRKEFKVDPDRTYLVGHSMGGAGALFLGQKHAREWAAVAAIAPAAFMMERDRAQILGTMQKAGVPVLIIQGDKDPVVPPANTRNWAETLKQSGMKGKYFEIPGGDHGTVIGDGMPEVFSLFAESVRKHQATPESTRIPAGGLPPGWRLGDHSLRTAVASVQPDNG